VPESVRDPIVLHYEADSAFGLMHIQIVGDKMPSRHLRRRGYRVGHRPYKVRFGPGRPQ
jgi:hypothetical protein